MNDDQYKMLVEVHTAVTGKGGLSDRVEKNSNDIDALKAFRVKFGAICSFIGAGVSALVSGAIKKLTE